MIVADLERANSRVATVERRNVYSIPCTPLYDYTYFPCRKYYEPKLRLCAVEATQLLGEPLILFVPVYSFDEG
jgi:hypothetical protein